MGTVLDDHQPGTAGRGYLISFRRLFAICHIDHLVGGAVNDENVTLVGRDGCKSIDVSKCWPL